jgi:hypothetical protein
MIGARQRGHAAAAAAIPSYPRQAPEVGIRAMTCGAKSQTVDFYVIESQMGRVYHYKLSEQFLSFGQLNNRRSGTEQE